MIAFAYLVLGASASLVVYYYVCYPLALHVLSWFRSRPSRSPRLEDWPQISISVPVFNEHHQIRELIESLLAIDYPEDRRQILLISDASTDGTDEIAYEYAGRGIELLRLPARMGKTAAENAARPWLRGEIVVNTDASVRIEPDAVKALVGRLADPSVGLASARDVSVGTEEGDRNTGESGYVGHEMSLRDLETRVEGIVGASGCLYAIRRELHMEPLPDALSRDFAAALIARELGYRAVSVPQALCFVPRAGSLQREHRRKVRTMTRGMQTLLHKRQLLNPLRHGVFAWMLFSHKVCRWLVPWAMAASFGALLMLAPRTTWAAAAGAVGALGIVAGLIGWYWPEQRPTPRIFTVPAYLLVSVAATLQATINALRGAGSPMWEPTRRDAAPDATHAAGGET